MSLLPRHLRGLRGLTSKVLFLPTSAGQKKTTPEKASPQEKHVKVSLQLLTRLSCVLLGSAHGTYELNSL